MSNIIILLNYFKNQVPKQIIYVDDPYDDPQYSQPHYVFVEDNENDNPKEVFLFCS
jgi:adenine-specific DNA methylase